MSWLTASDPERMFEAVFRVSRNLLKSSIHAFELVILLC